MPMAENDGEVTAGALPWSGNYKMKFELDEFNALNISLRVGISPPVERCGSGGRKIGDK